MIQTTTDGVIHQVKILILINLQNILTLLVKILTIKVLTHKIILKGLLNIGLKNIKLMDLDGI